MLIPNTVFYIITRLEAHGYEAYTVGGAVRDSMLGKDAHDFDICTSATPAQILEVFADFRTIRNGEKHGTIGVVISGEVYEITTYRNDGDYTDNRHPDSVIFVSNIQEDLARRDFTVNAMAASGKGEIIDPFDGKDDLEHRIIRAVGNASKRFEEDALRILRALRFASVLDFTIDNDTSRAIHEKKALLANIAAERIKVEIDKLLCGDGTYRIMMEYHDVFAQIIPELDILYGYNQQSKHHAYDLWEHTIKALCSLPKDATLRWAMLLHDIGKPYVQKIGSHGEAHYKMHPSVGAKMATDILARLKFDNTSKQDIIFLVLSHDCDIPTDTRQMRHRIAQFGKERTKMLLTFKKADNFAKSEHSMSVRNTILDNAVALYEECITSFDCYTLKDLKINGSDLIAEKIASGRMIGELLKALLYSVIDGYVENDRSELLKLARKYDFDTKLFQKY